MPAALPKINETILRFEVFSLEKLWTLDSVLVPPTPLGKGISMAVRGGGFLSLMKAYIYEVIASYYA